ncbi:MAG: glutaredoxin family protein [Acidobacteria bacterium]|nr:glutaredoxin family protein [Acidobacteriota bacterium]
MASNVHLYGTGWCGLTKNLQGFLESTGVAYEYHDVEADPKAEQAILDMNGGKRRFPMVTVGDEVMKNPPLERLQASLAAHGALH